MNSKQSLHTCVCVCACVRERETWGGRDGLITFAFLKILILFIYLAASGLICNPQELPSLRCVGSLVVACELLVAVCRI